MSGPVKKSATRAVKAATKAPYVAPRIEDHPVRTAPAPRAQVTKAANSAAPIDFDRPRDPATFTGGRASPWVNKVKELVAGVQAGRGQFDEFFRLGGFTAASGARTTIRNLGKQFASGKLQLPVGIAVNFEVEHVSNPDGTRGSELWAAVLRVETAE